MGYDERDSRGFPKRWTGLAATGTNQATAFPLLDGGYHEFTTVGSGTGAVLPVVMPWSREITISNNGANALLIYPPSGGTIDTTNASVSLAAGSSATYWATSPTNWQDRVTGGSGGGGGGGSTTIAEVSQTSSFTAAANGFYAISGSSNVTATLPSAVGIAGQTIRIRCVPGYNGLCTIATVSSQTINGSTTRIIYAGESPLLQSDGANWVRTGGTIVPCTCQITLGTDQSVTFGSQPVVQLNTVAFDNSGFMTTAVSSFEVAIFRPGQYLVTAQIGFRAMTSNTQIYVIAVNIFKNGSQLNAGVQATVASATGIAYTPSLNAAGQIVLAAGDLLTVKAYQNNSTTTTETLSASGGNFLTVVEVPSW
jgi:hypothetical protein